MNRDQAENYKGNATHRWRSIRRAVVESAKETGLSTGQVVAVVRCLHANLARRKNGFKGLSRELDQINLAMEYRETT